MMRHKHFQLLRDKTMGWVAAGMLVGFPFSAAGVAQLVPDATLGSQSSTVRVNGATSTVEGGIRVGGNLFHSFAEFNIPLGRSLYFTDPGVSHILTRVTGSQPSTIDGRLGVLGSANLFLLNPNGIVFGPNASLDIRGSFTASTAAAIAFADGSAFSATQPLSPTLLTVSVPLGLQRGTNQAPATLVNRGRLVVGQDLVLDGDRLDLQGHLEAGQNLTLQAQDTVQVRDTPSTPFWARAGGNLTVRGDRGIDILALAHPAHPAFVSGGNLSLISDGVISGDAQFRSGGNLHIRSVSGGLATFTSLYDPILSSTGDVDLALNYSGAALLIEAGGNIRIQGNVDITAPDVAAPFVGEDGVLNQQPGLILRSGQTTLRYGGSSDPVPGSAIAVGLVPNPGITVQGTVTVAPGGVVRFTADGAGSINTQAIAAPTGAIGMTSANAITTNGQPLTVGSATANAGTIRLDAANGDLATGDLVASSDAAAAFTTETVSYGFVYNGPTYTDSNGITYIDGEFYTFEFSYDRYSDSGNGGAIALSNRNGTITTGNLAVNALSSANAGNGGTVAIASTNGNIAVGSITAAATGLYNAGNGGSVNITSTNGHITTGNITSTLTGTFGGVGAGGSVAIASTNGDLAIGQVNLTMFAAETISTPPGTIALTTQNGHITTADMAVDVSSEYGRAGQAGEISVSSTNGHITTGSLNARSGSIKDVGGLADAGNGGTIRLVSRRGDITTQAISAASIGVTSSQDGGRIDLASDGGRISTGKLDASSFSAYNSAGSGGRITIAATDSVRTQDVSTFALTLGLGTTGGGGEVNLVSDQGSLQTGNVLTFATTILFAPSLEEEASDAFKRLSADLRSRGHGPGGPIHLTAAQDITTGAISTASSDGSGAIAITAGQRFAATGTILSSDTFGAGTAGDVQLAAQSVQLTNGAQISASTHATGQSGKIAIATQNLLIEGASSRSPVIDLSVQSPFGLTVLSEVYLGGYVPTGDISNIPKNSTFPSGIFAQNTQTSTGNAGAITVQTDQLTLRNQGTISATTFGAGNGGNITLQQTGAATLDGGAIFSGVAPGATGNSGAIALAAQSLTLTNGGRIQTQTLGSGQAGKVQVAVAEGITLSGPGSDIRSGSGDEQHRGSGLGAGGDIQLVSGSLELSDRAAITAETFTTSNAGSVTVLSRDRLALNGGGQIRTGTSGAGQAGAIQLGTATAPIRQVTLTNGGRIQTLTLGPGAAGDIQVQAHAIAIADPFSGIISGSSTPNQRGIGLGNGGNIQLATGTLDIWNDGIVSASTFSDGRSGNIDVTAQTITLSNQGRLSATTQSQGDAGSIAIVARDRLTITGQRSGLFANTTPQSSGAGGNIFVTAHTLQLQDRGRITTGSQGLGRGGDITLATQQLTLDQQAAIIAETSSTQGGNIQIDTRDLLILRRNSLISASAGTAQAGGDGGNITIRAGFVLGILDENSDITANAFTGNGGRVDITAQGIFGLRWQPRLTPFSDITASSSFGVNGTVTLNTLNVDPNRGLEELPGDLAETRQQIAETCSPRQRRNSFVVTGRGGLAPNPTEALNQTGVWQEETTQGERTPQPEMGPRQTALVEATRWYQHADGSVSLVAPIAGPVAPLVTQHCHHVQPGAGD